MWCIWCSARSPAPSCLPVLLSDCPRVAVWRLSGGRRVILGGGQRPGGPCDSCWVSLVDGRGSRSRTKCRMVHLLRWVTHLNRRIISSVFVGYSTARVLWNGSPVSEGKQSLGVRVVVWRHAVDILSCRQTWSSPAGGGLRTPSTSACNTVQGLFFSTQRKNVPTSTLPPADLEEEGKKKSAS